MTQHASRPGRRPWPVMAVLLVVTIMAAATGQARADQVPDAARWISAPEVVLYAEVSRPEVLIDRVTSERTTRLLRAIPGIDQALKSPKARELRQVVRYLSGVLETEPEEGLRKLVGGGIVLAVEATDRPDRVYLIVTPTDPAFLADAHARLVELARRDAEQKGKPDPIREAEYRGIRGYSVDKGEAHTIVGGKLIVASGGDALKALIDRIQDGDAAGRPLSEDPIWRARREAAGEESAAWAMLNLAKLREIDPKTYAPDRIDPGALFLLGPWAEAARRADWASLSLTWTDARLAAELALPTPEEGYGEAMSGYLPPQGQGASAPLDVPGVIASGSLWRDLAAIWEVRGEIFPAEAQQGFAQLDSFAGTFFGGRDFGSGVLGSVGQRWRVVAARQDPKDLDPVPDVLLPAAAIVVDLDADDADFALRLRAAFQSFVGLANLGAAQSKAPPLMLGSEEHAGATLSTARFLPSQDRPEGEPVHQRHNLSPSAVQVGEHFVLSTSTKLAKDLVDVLKRPPSESAEAAGATLLLEADGPALAGLIDQNRERLVLDNMLKKGNDRDQAEGEVDLFAALVRFFGHGTLKATDTPDGLRVRLDFDLHR